MICSEYICNRLFYAYDEERYIRGHCSDVDQAGEHALTAVLSQEKFQTLLEPLLEALLESSGLAR